MYNILEICYFVHVKGFDQEKGYKFHNIVAKLQY